jgi:drug/metabolite transporter (DMT)-like permease
VKARNRSILQALLVVFLWSTSWVFIKFGLKQISPLTFAGLRYSVAFMVLLIVLILQRKQLGKIVIARRTWLLLLLLAVLLYAGAQGGQFVALAYMPSITVNLLFSFSSVIVAMIGAAWLGEKLTWLQWTGLALTLAGSWVYFFPVSIPHAQLIGLVAALMALLSNSISTVLGRDLNRSNQLSPLLVTLIPMGIGSGIMLAAGVSIEGMPHIDLKGWAIILWLAVVNTAFAFTLWNHTLRTLTAIESSIINGTMMIWIPLLAVLVLGETLTTQQVLGLVVTAIGAWIVQYRASRKPLKVADGG